MRERLKTERNWLIVSFAAVIFTGILLRLLGVNPDSPALLIGAAITATVAARAWFLIHVIRASRWLGHPVWMTVLYSVFALVTVLYVIPVIALLVGIEDARRRPERRQP